MKQGLNKVDNQEAVNSKDSPYYWVLGFIVLDTVQCYSWVAENDLWIIFLEP